METDRIFFFQDKKSYGIAQKRLRKNALLGGGAMTVILTPRNRFSTKIIGHETILMIISGALH